MNKKNIKNFLVYLKDLIGKCWNDKFYSKSKEVSDEPEYINETIPNQKENDIDIIPPFKNDFDDAERYLLGLCEKEEYKKILEIISDSRISQISRMYKHEVDLYEGDIKKLYEKRVKPKNGKLYDLSETVLKDLVDIVKNRLILDIVGGADKRIINNGDDYGLFQQLKDSVFEYIISIGFYKYEDDDFDGTIKEDYYLYYELCKQKTNDKSLDGTVAGIERPPYIIYYYDGYDEISLDNRFVIDGSLSVYRHLSGS